MLSHLQKKSEGNPQVVFFFFWHTKKQLYFPAKETNPHAVTTVPVVQHKSMQGIDNKGHNHSTTLQYINMKYILKAINHPTIEENLTSKYIPPHPRAYIL
jgi:diaminopimelate epimerase